MHREPKGHVDPKTGEHDGGQFAPDFSKPLYTNKTFDFKAPPEIEQLAQNVNAHGYQLYVVGGTLRDIMSGRKPKDWDVATSANPDEIKAMYAGQWRSNNGEDHGTILVPAGNTYVELTSFRKDEDSDGRHATVSYQRDLTVDLGRRDLTVGALAWGPLTKELVGPGPNGDPSSALADIQHRVIRFNSTNGDNGEDVIKFDTLRAVRAVRFAQMGDGWHLAPEAKQAIINTVPIVREAFNRPFKAAGRLSPDRFKDELIKGFGYPNGGHMLRYLHEVGLLDVFHPELTKLESQTQNVHHTDNVLEHILKVTESVGGPNRKLNRFATMFHDVGKSATDYVVNGKTIAKGTAALKNDTYGYSFIGHEDEGAKIAAHVMGSDKYNYPTEIRDRAVSAIQGHMEIPKPDASDKAIRKWARKIGPENVEDALALRKADFTSKATHDYPADYFENRVLNLMKVSPPSKPTITGNDIMGALLIPPGKAVGAAMKVVEDYLDTHGEAANRREVLLNVAKDWYKDQPHV